MKVAGWLGVAGPAATEDGTGPVRAGRPARTGPMEPTRQTELTRPTGPTGPTGLAGWVRPGEKTGSGDCPGLGSPAGPRDWTGGRGRAGSGSRAGPDRAELSDRLGPTGSRGTTRWARPRDRAELWDRPGAEGWPRPGTRSRGRPGWPRVRVGRFPPEWGSGLRGGDPGRRRSARGRRPGWPARRATGLRGEHRRRW